MTSGLDCLARHVGVHGGKGDDKRGEHDQHPPEYFFFDKPDPIGSRNLDYV